MAASVLAMPGVATATHADGFVFTFTLGNTAPSDFCKLQTPLSSCNPITQFADLSSRYLGTFGEETVVFGGMDYLGGHGLVLNRAYLSFDLILTDLWYGNGLPGQPDFGSSFTVVANGVTILDTTFSNISGVAQAYPGSRTQGSNPAGTGSTQFASFDDTWNSIYHIDRVFELGLPPNTTCCAFIDIRFAADLGAVFEPNGAYTPKWGLDNVVVSSTPIPEPATGALLGLGLLALGARRRRA